MKYHCSLILSLFLFITCPLLEAEAPEKDPYRFAEESMIQAEDEKKLIYLFIGSDVCLESRHFLRQIAQDDEYFDLVSKRYLFRVLDYDLNPSLALRYSLPTIPGFLILDHKGNIYLGGTRPEKEQIFPILQSIVDQYENDPDNLLDELHRFQEENPKTVPPQSIESILDSTMNLPNHLSLDLGRYILSLPASSIDFQRYLEQLLEWIKSENFDFVEGSFFMPRGYCTFHAEGKYSFFNFKLQEMLIDFYTRTGNPALKHGFLKSLKYLKRDLFLSPKTAYSIGYGSKKYFQLPLKTRLMYYPPSPRRSDLTISQVIYLKILYKLHHLLNLGRISSLEIEFLRDHIAQKPILFEQIISRYQREDGLLYFTSEKKYTNFETQVEYFSLLQLMEQIEKPKAELFFSRMESLIQSFHKHFFDPEQKMYQDIPVEIWKKNTRLYQYPLYFVREHSRLFLFLNFLKDRTGKPEYEQMLGDSYTATLKHNSRNPHRFYWLNWYRNILRNKLLNEKNTESGEPLK